MSQQSKIYERYLTEFYKTHKEVKLVEIESPRFRGIQFIGTAEDNDKQIKIVKLKTGKVISWILSHGWWSKFVEGDYREYLKNKPMSHSQYFEF